MIKSMTGFASQSVDDPCAVVSVTIRTVNHRYLDVQLRTPTSLATLEPRLRALVQQHVGRGRVDVSLSVQGRQDPVVTVELNETLTTALMAALEKARAAGLVSGTLSPGDLLRVPQALAIREQPPAFDEAAQAALAEVVERALAQTLVELDDMRTREGGLLRADLDARRDAVLNMVERIAEHAAAGETALRERLSQRVTELSADVMVDRASIAQEVVRFAARSDISEEVVRFRSHAVQWAALSDSPEPCGRKLDFLLQEMNREVNTMGSKADGPGVPELVVSAKAELEKMREQVQNVE